MLQDPELLLKEIRQHPEQDHLRLIYADAIQEAGEEDRAAYIRQEMDTNPKSLFTEEVARLWFWASHYFNDRLHYESLNESVQHGWFVEKGFAKSARWTFAEWCVYGEPIWQKNPIETVEIVNRTQYSGRPTSQGHLFVDEDMANRQWVFGVLGPPRRLVRTHDYILRDRQMTPAEIYSWVFHRLWHPTKFVFRDT